MFEMRKDDCGIDEVLALSEEYAENHLNTGMIEAKLYYKKKYKLVKKGMLKTLPQRIQIAADLEEFEAESGKVLSERLECFIGIDISGYHADMLKDYDNICEIARLYAEDMNSAVFVVSHFKENRPGKFVLLPAHLHILYSPGKEKFEDYIDRFLENFEDREK